MNTSSPDFDSIKQTNMYGVEYWSARDLMPLLGYDYWQNFEHVIKKAMTACESAKQDTLCHFLITNREIVAGRGAIRRVIDYHLTRYALHLTLLFTDISKPEIAQTLAYFTLASLKEGFDYSIMVQKFNSSIVKPITMTKERRTIGEIVKAFSHLHMIQQYKVTPYRIDLYFPTYKIAVECDEEGHRGYDRGSEVQRQTYIEQKLGCVFIRYNPDDPNFHVGDVIHKIMIAVYNERRLSYA
ncbi:MAG TPA: hypothetical protein VKR06_12150 [Ktedonosporobacter sp.]|nr:hypothetical protein [Ktedonosporobacter sp.]